MRGFSFIHCKIYFLKLNDITKQYRSFGHLLRLAVKKSSYVYRTNVIHYWRTYYEHTLRNVPECLTDFLRWKEENRFPMRAHRSFPYRSLYERTPLSASPPLSLWNLLPCKNISPHLPFFRLHPFSSAVADSSYMFAQEDLNIAAPFRSRDRNLPCGNGRSIDSRATVLAIILYLYSSRISLRRAGLLPLSMKYWF